MSDHTAGEFVLGDAHATILTTAGETDGRHDLLDVVQPPGAKTPRHLHTRYEERLWVLDGDMTVWLGDRRLPRRAGELCTIPMDVPHAIHVGPSGARALVISSPAGFAELVVRAGVPVGSAAGESGLDGERLLAVAHELGDVILGPPGLTPADLELE